MDTSSLCFQIFLPKKSKRITNGTNKGHESLIRIGNSIFQFSAIPILIDHCSIVFLVKPVGQRSQHTSLQTQHPLVSTGLHHCLNRPLLLSKPLIITKRMYGLSTIKKKSPLKMIPLLRPIRLDSCLCNGDKSKLTAASVHV